MSLSCLENGVFLVLTIVFLCYSFGEPLGILVLKLVCTKIFPLHMRFKHLNLIFLMYVALWSENIKFGTYLMLGRECWHK